METHFFPPSIPRRTTFPLRKMTPIRYTEFLKPISSALEASAICQPVEEKRVAEARKILGALAEDLSSEAIQEVISETKFLTGSWLDDFERQIFEGKTVLEILHQKGGP